MLVQHTENIQDVGLASGNTKGYMDHHRMTLFMRHRARRVTAGNMVLMRGQVDTTMMKTNDQSIVMCESTIPGKLAQVGDSLQQIASWRTLTLHKPQHPRRCRDHQHRGQSRSPYQRWKFQNPHGLLHLCHQAFL